MPIYGLTDTTPSFPRIGELRKGAEKKGNKPGTDLKYFRFTSNDQAAILAFNAAYPQEPDAIRVFLPFKTAADNFEAWIEEWGAGSLKWRGNGRNLVIWQTKEGQYSKEPKPQPEGGKQVGRLKVILPELGRLAYVVALTTSKHDIRELSSNLAAYEALRGSLQGIPFILSRVPRLISTPIKGKRVRTEKWLLHIEAEEVWVRSQLQDMQKQALPSSDKLAITAVSQSDILEGDLDEDEEVDNWDDLKSATEGWADGELVWVQGKNERRKGAIVGHESNGISGDYLVSIEGLEDALWVADGKITTYEPEDEIVPLSDNVRKALHALGTSLYGKEWDDIRHDTIAALTDGRTESSNELTPSEAAQLTEMMSKVMATISNDKNALANHLQTVLELSDVQLAWNAIGHLEEKCKGNSAIGLDIGKLIKESFKLTEKKLQTTPKGNA